MTETRADGEPNSGVPEACEKASAAPKGAKRIKVTYATKMALVEVLETKKYRPNPNYRAIAVRHGVSHQSLRQIYVQWKKGRVDLGEPESASELEVDARVEMTRSMNLMRRLERALNDAIEAKVTELEMRMRDSKKRTYREYYELGVNELVGAKAQLKRAQKMEEEGYLAILDAVKKEEQERLREKEVKAAAIPAQAVVEKVTGFEAFKLKAAEVQHPSHEAEAVPAATT